jgi:hypothetical protein
MKYIFITICSIILSPFLANQITPKLCINCKFYTKRFFTISEFGKCTLFPKGNYDTFFVNGKNNNNKEYYYCYTSREFDDMCGKEGKFYEKKINKTF